MATDLLLPLQVAGDGAKSAPDEGEARFAERRRIVLMEPEGPLRAVLVRTLLRLGCIVSLTRGLDQVLEALRESEPDGALVALEADARTAALLQAANRRQIPIVVMCFASPEPHLLKRFAAMHFLVKPFDTRELLAHLRLPEKAIISGDGKIV
jgi:DNA-binding response OmpR family regulator